MTTYNVTATATTASTNLITVDTVINMVSGMPIVFTGTAFGGIVAGSTYYIKSITQGFPGYITVSGYPNGATFTLTSATGSMVGTFNSAGQQVINTGAMPNDGTGDPLRTAFNDTNLNFDQIFAAGPVLSNIQIANNSISTLNTNGNLVLNPNGTGVVQPNSHIVPDNTRIRNLGSSTKLWSGVYTQNINVAGTATIANVNISGGTITLPVADLHISGGSNGYVLQTDGTGNLTWTAQTGGMGNGVPGGANTQVQYNDAGAFGGTAGFTFDNTSNTLSAVKINTTDVFNSNGIVLENSDLTQGATAAVVIPANGSTDPIQVNNTYGNIALQTGAGSGITASWLFNSDGTLSLPAGNIAGLGNVIGPGNISYPFGPGPVLLADNSANNGAYFSLTAVANASGVLGYVGMANFGGNSSTGLVETSDSTGNTYDWYFNSDGTTAFPGYTFPNVDGVSGQVFATYGNGAIYWANSNSNTFSAITMSGTPSGPSNQIKYGMGNLVSWLDGQWTIGEYNGNAYGTQGIRVSPGIEGNVEVILPSDAAANTNALQLNNYVGNVQVTANNNYWTFGADGSFTPPTQPSNDRTGSGLTLKIGDTNSQAIITGPGPVANVYNAAPRLVVAGQDGVLNGEGGDIYLWAGRSGPDGGSGGDIKVDAGIGQNGSEGGTIKIRGGNSVSGAGSAVGGFVEIDAGSGNVGGQIYITAGTGDTQGGNANVAGGYAYNGPGGQVNIIGGGSSLGLPAYGNVLVATGASNWLFDNTGELTLPTGGRLGFAGKGWTGLDGGNGSPVSLTSFYANGFYSGCVTNGDGNIQISTYTGDGLQGSWLFDSGANLVLAPTNFDAGGPGSGESAKLRGTRKIVNGYTNTYAYSTVLAAGGTPTVAYTATDNSVMSVKITFAVEGANGVWEQFDVSAVIDSTGNDVNFTVSNRVKRNTAIPDTVVTAAVDGSDRITIALNLDVSQSTGWSSFDAVEFGLMAG